MTLDRRAFLSRCAGCAAALALGSVGAESLRAAPGAGTAPSADPLGLGVQRWTRTVCDLCGLGEPVFLGTREGRLAAVKGIPLSTVGFGRLCPRARALVAAATTPDRATTPMVRRDPSTKGTPGGLEPASWDEALARAAEGLRAARDRLGPGGLAVFASDAETCETYGLLSRVARAGLGTDHLDTPARLDALHAAAACEAAFGLPANPGTLEDVDAAGLVLLVGGEVADSHPALFYRLLDGRRSGRVRVALVDARRTEASSIADLHLRPHPGHEVAIVNALAARLIASGGATEAAEWRAWLEGRRAAPAPVIRTPLEPARVSAPRAYSATAALREAGLEGPEIDALEKLWRDARGVVTVVGPSALGTPAGAALARAVAQLHRALGQWGSAGRGPIFLPRGGNATGAIAFGFAAGRLAAGGRITDPADRERAAAAWSIAPGRLPAQAGLPALEWPAAVEAGRIGAFVLQRANPAAEMPDSARWRRALKSAFVVATTTHVPSETTAFADVVLPVALVAGESSGTMMTLDRRCHALERAAEPPGEARPAERIVADLARVMLGGDAATLVADDWTPFAEWDRWRAASAGTVFEARGLSAIRLGRELGVAWPCAAEDQPGTARWGAGGGTPAPPARYAPTPSPAGPGRAGADRPLVLTAGPLREHTGSRVRTGRTPELHYDAPVAQLEMHPGDAQGLGLVDGDWVTVESEAGAATVRLWLTDRSLPGYVFLPEHFGALSDLQGGSLGQGEPEGLAHRITGARLVSGVDAPAGLVVPVSVRKARRRDLRERSL